MSVVSGQWTVDSGQWTVDRGRWATTDHRPPTTDHYSSRCLRVIAFGFVAIEHPVNTVLVGEHTETLGPECLRHRHRDVPAVSHFLEHCLGTGRVVRADSKRDVATRRNRFTFRIVARHNMRIADLQRAVHN